MYHVLNIKIVTFTFVENVVTLRKHLPYKLLLFFNIIIWRNSPQWARASHSRGFSITLNDAP
jgi:hypothetical protein